MSKRRLGKGIDALLQGRDLEQLSNMSSILQVEIGKISPNPDQPRKHFPEESLRELADSIREKGVIQPILAEDRGDGHFIIIAGERRYRAAQIAGLSEIPVISQEFSDEEKLEIALIENIQREDLNPVDEARAIQHILDQTGSTQDELAKRLGKSRPALANSLRLLKLNDDELDALAAGRLTPGHARALLHIRDENKRRSLLEQIVADKLSVRAAEYVAAGREIPPEEFTQQDLPNDAAPSERTPAPETAGKTEPREDTNVTAGEGALKSPELQQIEDKLIGHIGGRVVIRGSDNRGKIEITYLSTEDLERILEVIGLKL